MCVQRCTYNCFTFILSSTIVARPWHRKIMRARFRYLQSRIYIRFHLLFVIVRSMRRPFTVMNIDRYILWLRKSTNKSNICFNNARSTVFMRQSYKIPQKVSVTVELWRSCDQGFEKRVIVWAIKTILFCEKMVFIDLFIQQTRVRL